MLATCDNAAATAPFKMFCSWSGVRHIAEGTAPDDVDEVPADDAESLPDDTESLVKDAESLTDDEAFPTVFIFAY